MSNNQLKKILSSDCFRHNWSDLNIQARENSSSVSKKQINNDSISQIRFSAKNFNENNPHLLNKYALKNHCSVDIGALSDSYSQNNSLQLITQNDINAIHHNKKLNKLDSLSNFKATTELAKIVNKPIINIENYKKARKSMFQLKQEKLNAKKEVSKPNHFKSFDSLKDSISASTNHLKNHNILQNLILIKKDIAAATGGRGNTQSMVNMSCSPQSIKRNGSLQEQDPQTIFSESQRPSPNNAKKLQKIQLIANKVKTHHTENSVQTLLDQSIPLKMKNQQKQDRCVKKRDLQNQNKDHQINSMPVTTNERNNNKKRNALLSLQLKNHYNENQNFPSVNIVADQVKTNPNYFSDEISENNQYFLSFTNNSNPHASQGPVTQFVNYTFNSNNNVDNGHSGEDCVFSSSNNNNQTSEDWNTKIEDKAFFNFGAKKQQMMNITSNFNTGEENSFESIRKEKKQYDNDSIEYRTKKSSEHSCLSREYFEETQQSGLSSIVPNSQISTQRKFNEVFEKDSILIKLIDRVKNNQVAWAEDDVRQLVHFVEKDNAVIEAKFYKNSCAQLLNDVQLIQNLNESLINMLSTRLHQVNQSTSLNHKFRFYENLISEKNSQQSNLQSFSSTNLPTRTDMSVTYRNLPIKYLNNSQDPNRSNRSTFRGNGMFVQQPVREVGTEQRQASLQLNLQQIRQNQIDIEKNLQERQDFHKEFMSNMEEFSLSWRKQAQRDYSKFQVERLNTSQKEKDKNSFEQVNKLKPGQFSYSSDNSSEKNVE